MRVLVFYARNDHRVEAPGVPGFVGRDSHGNPTREGARVVFYGRENVPEPPATFHMLVYCWQEKLWAGDEQTAKAAGVEYVPLRCVVSRQESRPTGLKKLGPLPGNPSVWGPVDEVTTVDVLRWEPVP